MDRRRAMAYGMIVTLAAAGASGAIDSAYAQDDDGRLKGVLKQGASQAVDPSSDVVEGLDRAKSLACDHDPHSPDCSVVTTTSNGVKAMFAVAGVVGILTLASAILGVVLGILGVMSRLR